MATATEPHEPPLRITPEADQLGRLIAIHVSAGHASPSPTGAGVTSGIGPENSGNG